jgi:hypothetical protein
MVTGLPADKLGVCMASISNYKKLPVANSATTDAVNARKYRFRR